MRSYAVESALARACLRLMRDFEEARPADGFVGTGDAIPTMEGGTGLAEYELIVTESLIGTVAGIAYDGGHENHGAGGGCRGGDDRPGGGARADGTAIPLRGTAGEPRHLGCQLAGRSDGGLFRRGLGRHLEDRKRRRELPAGLRPRGRLRHWRAGGGTVGAEYCLGRNRRAVDHPAADLARRWRLSFNRQRRPLAAHGPGADRAYRRHRDQPEEPGERLCLRG